MQQRPNYILEAAARQASTSAQEQHPNTQMLVLQSIPLTTVTDGTLGRAVTVQGQDTQFPRVLFFPLCRLPEQHHLVC